jgi:hypothetical protein
MHLCEQIVEAAHHLQAAGMTADQLSRLHHFSLQGRRISYPLVYSYFGVNKNLRDKNSRFGGRLVSVANGHREKGPPFPDLVDRALRLYPL